MKGNNGSGNVEERDVWETPKSLFNKLTKQYIFYFDCCANEKNTKCVLFSSDFEKQKEKISNSLCWMNPPFSKSYEMFEHFFKIVESGIAIYRCDNMETKIWQEIILKKASWIFIPKGRINYESLQGSGSRFPSALIGFGVEPPKEIEGTILYLN